jgi:hypothetical protein
MNLAKLIAADAKPSASEIAAAMADDIALIAAKFGKEGPDGFVPNAALAARLSRLIAINLHERHEEEAADVFKSLHGVIEAENRAAWGVSVDAYEDAVSDFAHTAEMTAEAMASRIGCYTNAA